MSWSKYVNRFLDAGVFAFLFFFANTFTSESSRQEEDPRRSRQEEQSSGPGGAGGGGSTAAGEDPFHTSAGDSESMKEAAFALFGMTIDEARHDPSAARTRLEKERRKLALRHHPDRNPENLEEAHRQMQRLNACYMICKTDLEEREHGGGGPARTGDDKENESDSDASASDEEGRESRYETEKDRQKAEKEREKERRKHERDQRNQERKEEREWKQHLETQERKVRAEIRRVNLENQGMSKKSKGSSKGKKTKKKKRRGQHPQAAPPPPAPAPERFTPPEAHAIWTYEVEQILSWWTPEQELNVPKPIQHTMANNPHFVAAAIRVGAADVVMEQVEMQAYVAWYSVAHRRSSYSSPTETEWMAAIYHVATEPLDDDMNTMLHYVSNYEDRNLFDFLLMHLGPAYADALLKKNVWGQVPADYCAVCKDRSFKERIDTATEHARMYIRERETRQAATGGHASTQLRQVLKYTDWFRLVHFLFAVGFVGPVLFQHGWLNSFVPFALLQHSSVAVFTIYACFWLARTFPYPVGGPFLLLKSYPVSACMTLAALLYVRSARRLAVSVVIILVGSLAAAIGTLEEFVSSRLLPSRLTKCMTRSQLACVELATYSALWWIASSIANGQVGLN